MITLYINKFTCNDLHRKKEYDLCYENNVANPLIDKIVLVKSEQRPSYEQIFHMMKEDSINIVANSDIYFDDTIQFALAISPREFWCLTRWEQVGHEIQFFTHRHPGVQARYSQDAWIMNGKPKINNASFPMGVPGCDNRIAWAAWSSGYIVRNPSYTIRAIHVHENDWRNPERDAEKLRPPYKWVTPETLRR